MQRKDPSALNRDFTPPRTSCGQYPDEEMEYIQLLEILHVIILKAKFNRGDRIVQNTARSFTLGKESSKTN